MIQSLDSMLAWHQLVRRIGETILLAGLAGEIGVLAFVDWKVRDLPAHVELKTRRLFAELTFAALILIGVGIENRASGNADDVVRRMRMPRSLTPAQQLSIANKLVKFGRPKPQDTQRVDIGTNPVTEEGEKLTRQLAAAFKIAEWFVLPSPAEVEGPPYGGPVSGVSVKPTSEPFCIARADAVIEALQSEGIEASRTEQFLPSCNPSIPPEYRPQNPACCRLLVIVGSHP
jgi:hypothetical protein